MTYWWESVRDTIALAKEIFPKSKVLLGGVYPTLIPKHAERHTGADVIVHGQLYSIADRWTDLSVYQEAPGYAVIMSSRGCHWDCSYCAQREISGGRVTYRAERDIVDEIRAKYEQHGIKRFILFADNFLTDRRHFRETMRLIVRTRGLHHFQRAHKLL